MMVSLCVFFVLGATGFPGILKSFVYWTPDSFLKGRGHSSVDVFRPVLID